MERGGEAASLDLDAWLALVRQAPELEGIPVSREEQRAVLDLTKIAAHRSERIAAPITAYLVGLAMGRLDPAARAERIRGLVASLDTEGGARSA
jgi:Domain of unknown function (DUF6457)